MSRYDLLIRNGTLVDLDDVKVADLAIDAGRVVAIEPELAGTAREEIDANGLHIFPGVIDAHVHFNEPGRTEWEGFATGTRALAAGGTTSFFDMPLNASPPTLDANSFALKRQAAQTSSLVDFALWGGLVPENLACLDELAACGVVGFKAFMSNSGIEDFSSVDDEILYAGMVRAVKLHKLVAVHAEDDRLTAELARQAIAQGRTSIRDYLASRPVAAELDAIKRAIQIAEETGCTLHIVHVSCGSGVALVAEARARGVDVSCETCPHYLVMTEEDVERLGAVAKCAPPLRTHDERASLWEQLLAGHIQFIASDHSPAPASMKASENFFQVWGGISGCQSLLQLLLGGDLRTADPDLWRKAHRLQRSPAPLHQIPLPLLASLTSDAVARRFHIPQKGQLAIGKDADMALVNLQAQTTLQASDLYYRHAHSPYIGRTLQGKIVQTLVRGITVYKNGQFNASFNPQQVLGVATTTDTYHHKSISDERT
jgi:allantoinase